MTIKFSRDEKKILLLLIQRYFAEERGEEIGDLAAEFFLDFVTAEIGPFIYNQAINDARKSLNETMSDLEYRLYELEKPTPKL